MKERRIKEFRIDIHFNNAVLSDLYDNGNIRIHKPIFGNDSIYLTEIELEKVRIMGKLRSELLNVPFLYFNHDLAKKVIQLKELKKT